MATKESDNMTQIVPVTSIVLLLIHGITSISKDEMQEKSVLDKVDQIAPGILFNRGGYDV